MTAAQMVIWAVVVVAGLLVLMGAALLVHLLLFDGLDELHDRRVLRRMVEPTPSENAAAPFDQFWDDVMKPYDRKDTR